MERAGAAAAREIERRYFAARGMDWGIVTENDVSRVLARNVEWLHQYRTLSHFTTLSEEEFRQVAGVLTDRVAGQDRSLRNIALECDNLLGLEPGTSLSVARHLLANRRWRVDMTKPLNPRERLIFISPPELN